MQDFRNTAHPFAGVDIAGLDQGHAALLAGAVGLLPDAAPSQGLEPRERWLFRLGALAGKGEWSLALDLLDAALTSGILDPGQALRAAQEAVHVLGWPTLARLGPFLSDRGLAPVQDLSDPAAALLGWTGLNPVHGQTGRTLTEREVFAEGLGLTWGARCWET